MWDEPREAAGTELPPASPGSLFRLHPPALVAVAGGQGPCWIRPGNRHNGAYRAFGDGFGRGRRPGRQTGTGIAPPVGRGRCRIHGPARFAMAGRFDRRPAAPAVSVRIEAARRWKGRRRFRNGPWCAILDPARAPYLHRGWLCCLTCPTRGACLFRVPVRRWRPLPPSWPIPSDRRRRAGCRPAVKRGGGGPAVADMAVLDHGPAVRTADGPPAGCAAGGGGCPDCHRHPTDPASGWFPATTS